MPLKRCGSVSARFKVWFSRFRRTANDSRSESSTSSPPGSIAAGDVRELGHVAIDSRPREVGNAESLAIRARCHAGGAPPFDQVPDASRIEGTITISVESMRSIERCSSIGTPLASINDPWASPTISTVNGASLSRRIVVAPFGKR